MKVVNFFPLLQDIFEKIKITIPRINDINSIFNYDISKFDKNSKEHLESIQLMEKSLFANNKKELIKYNNKFYTKKIAPIADYFLRKGNGDDLTEVKCITEYDRKGRIINKFGKLLEDIGIKSSFKLMMKNPKNDFDVNMEKGDILYIEILPIILADFLQENNEFVVIDLDKEDIKFLKDIKTLFDEGLLKKINEDENLNIFRSSKSNKENTIKKNKLNLAPDEQKKLLETQKYKIEKNIKLYQNLLLNKKKKGEPYNHITDIISKMEKEKERIEKAKKARETLGLGDRINFRPNQLSGGQQQRVAIARAIVGSPEILLADEPTGALDTKSGFQIMELFQQLHEEGVTIIMITHEEEIAECAQRIVSLRDGNIVDLRPGKGKSAIGGTSES